MGTCEVRESGNSEKKDGAGGQQKKGKEERWCVGIPYLKGARSSLLITLEFSRLHSGVTATTITTDDSVILWQHPLPVFALLKGA